jgi:hypothetical protein
MTPTDFLNVAETGITSGNAWDSKYPQFNPGFITQAAYLAHHTTMRNTILAQIATNDARSQVVLNLKTVNALITKHTKFIKNYLTEEYDNDAKTYYTGYGIITIGRAYSIPTDNDHRMRSLDTLIAELSKPNNVLANKKFGLAFWEDLRDQHRTNWTSLKMYDGDRSMNSNALKIAKKEALSYQSRLRASIKIMYPTNYKPIFRDFGFQSEKY